MPLFLAASSPRRRPSAGQRSFAALRMTKGALRWELIRKQLGQVQHHQRTRRRPSAVRRALSQLTHNVSPADFLSRESRFSASAGEPDSSRIIRASAGDAKREPPPVVHEFAVEHRHDCAAPWSRTARATVVRVAWQRCGAPAPGRPLDEAVTLRGRVLGWRRAPHLAGVELVASPSLGTSCDARAAPSQLRVRYGEDRVAISWPSRPCRSGSAGRCWIGGRAEGSGGRT